MNRWREAVLILQGWWTWGAVVVGFVLALGFYEWASRPTRVRVEPVEGLLVRPVAVDTGGTCRVGYWQLEVRQLP
jgi:hypothetical protein